MMTSNMSRLYCIRWLVAIVALAIGLLVLLPIHRLPTSAYASKAKIASAAKQPPYLWIKDVDSNVTYCSPGGVPQLLDLYYPMDPLRTPDPIIVSIHGGAFVTGDKVPPPNDLDALLQRGFVVAEINYRLAPTYPWPAQIEDAKCAVRFLRENAARFGIDAAHIGAIGNSAGGVLAALLGVAGPSAGWDIGQYLDQSSAVQAVVDLYGAADFSRVSDFSSTVYQATLSMVFGSNQSEMNAASPINFITPADPPFLFQHGLLDSTISYTQSELFYQKLLAIKVPAQLQLVQNAGHEFVPTPPGAIISPSLSILASQASDFLASHL